MLALHFIYVVLKPSVPKSVTLGATGESAETRNGFVAVVVVENTWEGGVHGKTLRGGGGGVLVVVAVTVWWWLLFDDDDDGDVDDDVPAEADADDDGGWGGVGTGKGCRSW